MWLPPRVLLTVLTVIDFGWFGYFTCRLDLLALVVCFEFSFVVVI